jgi:hypothetical protein
MRPLTSGCRVSWAAAVVTLCASAGCATQRWTEQWLTLPAGLRSPDARERSADGVTAMGNRGFRFGERMLLVTASVPLDDVPPGVALTVPVRCVAGDGDCSGHLVVERPQQKARLVLVLQGVMARFAAITRLYLETDVGDRLFAVGPFDIAYQLDLAAPGVLRSDAVSLSCVAREAAVLAASELSRAKADLESERINTDDAAMLSEALVRYVGFPGERCLAGRAGAGPARTGR